MNDNIEWMSFGMWAYIRSAHNGDDMSKEPGDEYPEEFEGFVIEWNTGNVLWICSK